MPSKIVGYVRVSDAKLKDDLSRRQDINRQKEKIIKFCESMGWEAPEFYSDDALSAFKDDYNSRPAFVRMLNEIRARRIKRVVLEDLTRWSRRIEDGLRTVRESTEAGCTITSMGEGEVNVTSPEAWFKTAVAFLLAEWASKSQSFKVASGMQRRLENPEAVCKSCNVVHLGRHPASCECRMCHKKRAGKEFYLKNKLNRDASNG